MKNRINQNQKGITMCENVAIAMHSNLRPPNVALVVQPEPIMHYHTKFHQNWTILARILWFNHFEYTTLPRFPPSKLLP